MTPEAVDALKEALKYLAPIGIALLAWGVQYINTRRDTEKKRQELALERQRVADERERLRNDAEANNVKNQEFIRSVAQDFQKQVQTVKTECEQEISALEKRVEAGQTDIKAKVQEIDGLRQQVGGLTDQLNVQTKQNTTLIDQNSQLIQDNADLKSDNAALKATNETLQNQHVDDDKALTAERAKNGNLEGQVQNMQQQIDRLKGQVRELQAKVGTGNLTPPVPGPTVPTIPDEPPKDIIPPGETFS